MKIKILYEDPNILVIDKPSGISVHGDGKTKEKTISDWFVKKYPKAKNTGESIFVNEKEVKKPGIVHRLDKETSGVLILVKNNKTYQFIKDQFQNREVKKIYHAIVNGFMKDDHGFIKKPIGRSPNDFRRYSAGRGARGEMREAETFYKVLKRFEIDPSDLKATSPLQGRKKNKNIISPPVKGECLKDEGVKFSYLEVRPKTGRTHQIRVHMKYLNHPIVCDSLYNPDGACPKDIKRLALHSKSIEFKDVKGNLIKVESPAPLEFSQFLK